MKYLYLFLAFTLSLNCQSFAQTKAKAALPAVDMINHVYFYQSTANQVTPLEKQPATMKTKMKFMGYGGANVLYVIDGEKSLVRVAQSDTLRFIVNTGGNAPEFTLYKVTAEKKTRQTITQKAKGTFSSGGGSTGGNSISVNMTVVKPGIYQLVSATPLEKGEYFFMKKPSLDSGSLEAFAFGID